VKRLAAIVLVGAATGGALAIVAGAPPTPRSAPTTPAPPGTSILWRLNAPQPRLVPESQANPVAVADAFAARMRSIEERAGLRAYDGAPPTIPHPIAGLSLASCRECHAEGLRAGEKVARMVSHTYLPNCTQCHVESAGGPWTDAPPPAANSFEGRHADGYGGTRAWTGAPPVIPHTIFMRTNCTSCHGEHGYEGLRPDHLSRTNCVQCHAPAAEFEQLAPSFGLPSRPDGF
jgi:cytochrome c-type protein NapB